MMNHGESIQMSETNGRILVQYFPKRGPIVTLTEWFGRTAGEFLAVMAADPGRYEYATESRTFGDRVRTWHTWRKLDVAR